MLRYSVNSVGRPREHDERTAAALFAAAERMVQESGPEALSVRGVAGEVGTTTRAVYSLFGSKEGLLAALGARAFDLLHEGLDALPTSDDPVADLVEAALMFRRFATEHPSLFAIGVQHHAPADVPWPPVRRAAYDALLVLHGRVERLAAAGGLGARTVEEATIEFHALCEGMAALELRCTPGFEAGEERWRSAFTALVAGFAAQPATPSHSS
jgi:AcrR family transcriptional regulator